MVSPIISCLVALLKSQILVNECFGLPSVFEVKDNGLICSWICDKAHHLVTKLVIILNAWAV